MITAACAHSATLPHCLLWFWGLTLGAVSLSANGTPAIEDPESGDALVAVVSGVRPPHQGFAFSVDVASSELCFSVGLNLASELGISVRVMCLSQSTGEILAGGECGFAESAESRAVTDYHEQTLVRTATPFLKCVPDQTERFPAKRLPPDLQMLNR